MQVNLLIRVHHRNLTTLVGYCKDGTNAGLIYEYMANGNLHKHLSGLAYLLEYIFLCFRIRLIKWQRKNKATNQLPATFITVPNNYTYWLLKTSTQTESFATINTCNTNLNSHRNIGLRFLKYIKMRNETDWLIMYKCRSYQFIYTELGGQTPNRNWCSTWSASWNFHNPIIACLIFNL